MDGKTIPRAIKAQRTHLAPCKVRGTRTAETDTCRQRASGRAAGTGPERAPLAARASGGGVTAARKRPRARANRAAHRPRSGTQRCEMPRTGKRPHPNAIWRLRSGAGAIRNGAFRARVTLGRWTAHADWHRTQASRTAPHTRKDVRLAASVRRPRHGSQIGFTHRSPSNESHNLDFRTGL